MISCLCSACCSDTVGGYGCVLVVMVVVVYGSARYAGGLMRWSFVGDAMGDGGDDVVFWSCLCMVFVNSVVAVDHSVLR